MKILHLTLHRRWFEAVASGEKTEEYRQAKPYWERRLEGCSYDEVHIRNGYGQDKPLLRLSCLGISRRDRAPEGAGIAHPESVYVIHLGPILSRENLAA